MPELALRDVVSRFVALFNDNDLDTVMTFFAADAEYRTVTGGARRGLVAIRREFTPQFRGDYGQMTFEVEQLAVDGVRNTAAVTWMCVHRFEGAPPAGARAALTYRTLRALVGRDVHWRGGDFFCFDPHGKISRKVTMAHAPLMRLARTRA